MATLSMNSTLYRTESNGSRVQLASLRTTHRDVVEFSNVVIRLSPDEEATYIVDRFFYAYFKTPMDTVTIEKDDSILTLTNLIGAVQFPFSCVITFSVPSDSDNRAKREAEVWFN